MPDTNTQLTPTRIYTDIGFTAHPLTGDITPKINDAAVKQSLRNLVSFGITDKPFHPEIYTGVGDLLFEPMGKLVELSIKTRIENIITQHEPRVKLSDVVVTPNTKTLEYSITIIFTILNQVAPLSLDILLKRVR